MDSRVNFGKLFLITEKLRAQAIGEPAWIQEKGVFEYADQSIKVVAVLKAVRAVQGIKSMHLLCENGLFIDMGAIYRCIGDCTAEIYFLLERYPESSSDVDQFVKAFFETTIDGHLNVKTDYVRVKKIQSAMVRILSGIEKGERARGAISRLYKTFCGYTHANYTHIMEIYGGTPSTFNLAGVSSLRQQKLHMRIVEQAYLSVLYPIWFAAQKLGLTELCNEVYQSL